MTRRTTRPVWTADQQPEAERLRRPLTDALAATTDVTLSGATEFAVRDLVLRMSKE
jgi:hypothetical protein